MNSCSYLRDIKKITRNAGVNKSMDLKFTGCLATTGWPFHVQLTPDVVGGEIFNPRKCQFQRGTESYEARGAPPEDNRRNIVIVGSVYYRGGSNFATIN